MIKKILLLIKDFLHLMDSDYEYMGICYEKVEYFGITRIFVFSLWYCEKLDKCRRKLVTYYNETNSYTDSIPTYAELIKQIHA